MSCVQILKDKELLMGVVNVGHGCFLYFRDPIDPRNVVIIDFADKDTFEQTLSEVAYVNEFLEYENVYDIGFFSHMDGDHYLGAPEFTNDEANWKVNATSIYEPHPINTEKVEEKELFKALSSKTISEKEKAFGVDEQIKLNKELREYLDLDDKTRVSITDLMKIAINETCTATIKINDETWKLNYSSIAKQKTISFLSDYLVKNPEKIEGVAFYLLDKNNDKYKNLFESIIPESDKKELHKNYENLSELSINTLKGNDEARRKYAEMKRGRKVAPIKFDKNTHEVLAYEDKKWVHFSEKYNFEICAWVPRLKNAKKENDRSVVHRIRYGNTTVLTMGDIEKEGFEDIIKQNEEWILKGNESFLKSDIFQLPHHGHFSFFYKLNDKTKKYEDGPLLKYYREHLKDIPSVLVVSEYTGQAGYKQELVEKLRDELQKISGKEIEIFYTGGERKQQDRTSNEKIDGQNIEFVINKAGYRAYYQKQEYQKLRGDINLEIISVIKEIDNWKEIFNYFNVSSNENMIRRFVKNGEILKGEQLKEKIEESYYQENLRIANNEIINELKKKIKNPASFENVDKIKNTIKDLQEFNKSIFSSKDITTRDIKEIFFQDAKILDKKEILKQIDENYNIDRKYQNR